MLNKYYAIIGLVVAVFCTFGAIAIKETEETKGVIATQEAQTELQSKEFEDNFRIAIDKCYDEYAEVEGKNTVVLVDGLSNIEYSIEDKDSKESILEQFIPLFKEVTKLGLDDKPLTDLFDVVLRG